jgi:hypothetical protein
MPNGAERVCLLGPADSGKSQLLAAMVKAASEGAYGYKASFDLTITPMDEKLRDARSTGRMGREILDRRREQTDYAKRVFDALSGDLASTDPNKVPSYDFDISYRARRQGEAQPSRFELGLTVSDAAGGHIFPRHRIVAEEAGEKEAARKELIDHIFESVGLVIVLPFHGVSQRHNARGMETLIAAIARAEPGDVTGTPWREPALKHIAIALHQYERLFMNFGPEAAELACHPEVARRVVERAVANELWFKKLVRLDRAYGGPYDIRILPTSAFGFLPGIGNPNVDPTADGNMPFSDAPEDPSEKPEHEFYPFLAADPFVFAATGIANEYMVGIETLVGDSQPAAAGFDSPPRAAETLDARPDSDAEPEMDDDEAWPAPNPSWLARTADRVTRAFARFFGGLEGE